MSLRTPNPLTSYQTQLDLQRSKERMAIMSQQLASGNKLVHLGDDPTGSALVLDFQNSIVRNKQFVAQATSASNFLNTTETSLSSLNDSITRLLEIGQEGLSDTTGANGRSAIAQEVNGIRDNVLSLANTQAEGKYIFGGTQTLNAPFSWSTPPTTWPANYLGNSGNINLDVSASSTISTNISGDQVFFGGAAGQGTAGDLFQQVTDLRDALNTNNTAGIQAAYNNLKTIQTRLNSQITDVGGRQSSIDQLKSDFQSYNLSLQSIQSTYQAVDYPTTITDYYQEQNSQQASLSMIAKTGKTNLFDYLS